MTRFIICLSLLSFALIRSCSTNEPDGHLVLNDKEYYETRGLNILVFSNWYNGMFSDSKMSGIEIIHHEERTATNGDVRLSPTPEQWDPIPEFSERKIHRENNTVEAFLSYPEYDFSYTIKSRAVDDGLYISVHLENPLPEDLQGLAGFNLEFLPSAYFNKTYMMDGKNGVFPRYPADQMEVENQGVLRQHQSHQVAC